MTAREQELMQRMNENTVRQAVDGLKYDIERDLRSEWKDAHVDYSMFSPEEQVEAYKAILDDLWNKLASHGIRPDEWVNS